MKPEQCKGCCWFWYEEFCTKFAIPANHLTPNVRNTIFVPIVCIPECEYAKGKS